MGALASRPEMPALHLVPCEKVQEAEITESGDIIFSLCPGGSKYVLPKKLFFMLLKKYMEKK